MDYHSHITKVQRTPTVYTDVPQYPNAHLTKKIVYEEDEIEGSRRRRHHLGHHNNPEIRERVEVVEYEKVPEYNRVGEVVYEEDVVETDQYYPRRNSGGVHTFRQY